VDRKRFQFSLASLLVVMTACAVLLSVAKMFPLAAAVVSKIILLAAGPVICAAGVTILFGAEGSNPEEVRFQSNGWILVGLLCLLGGVAIIAILFGGRALLDFLWHLV
jgi:hypothetical protein